MKILTAALLAASVLTLPACAQQAQPGAPLAQAEPAQDVRSPYQAALVCLKQQMTPEQRNTSFAVLSFPDETGKQNLGGSDYASGAFSTQGGAEMLMTALAETGVRVVEVRDEYRSLVKWNKSVIDAGLATDDGGQVLFHPTGTPETNLVRSLPQMAASISLADITIEGAITSLDSEGGTNAQASIFNMGPGYQDYGVLVGMNAYALRSPNVALNPVLADTPFGQALGGQVIAPEHLVKEIRGREFEAGGTSFFGLTLVNLDFDQAKRESLQLSESFEIDRLAYSLVADSLDNPAASNLHASCDRYVTYADSLATGSVP